MNLLFFFYTVMLIGVALVACSVSLVVWLMTRRRDCVVAALGYAVYGLDLSLIFFDEYARNKHDYLVTFEQPLTHPVPSLVLGLTILLCLWVWVLLRTHVEVKLARIITFVVPVGVLMLVFVPRSGASGTVQQYLYWLTRDMALLACLVFAGVRYRFTDSRAVKLDLERSRTFFIVAAALILCVIAEDTLMILIIHPPADSVAAGSFFWHLQERNISENVLMVATAVQLFRRYREIFSVYARHPNEGDLGGGAVSMDGGDVASKLALFAEAHKLSKREVEVLDLLVRGADVQGIASELVISPGTVKAHLHRIYGKVGVNARADLLDAFWRR
ncbi:MAG: helix-turn-helix domain-containing protein [Collinsella phocaeensis]